MAFELTVLNQSPTGIDASKGQQILDIQYWRDFTIVISYQNGKAGDQILVFDQHGERVKDFDEIGHTEIKYDSNNIVKLLKEKDFSDINFSRNTVVHKSGTHTVLREG